MARDGAGNYDLPGADFTNGTLADATEMMTKLDDIASALTSSIAKDGQTVPTAALPMGTYNHTNVGVATARTHYARASQIADGSLTYGGVATGTADALAIAPSPAITAYAIGQQFQFKVGASANTGAVTINVNNVGAGAVTWPDGTALAAGDLPANAMVLVEVQAVTPVFHLQTQSRAPGSFGGVITATGATFTSTDAGASAGPSLNLYRNSTSPAASDELGELEYQGEDSAGNTETYAREYGIIVDATSTSEDAELRFDTVIAGALANRLRLGAGLYTPAATGGDKGVDSINAARLYSNGAGVWQTLDSSAASGATYTLDSIPSWVNNLRISLDLFPVTDNVTINCTFRKGAGTDIAGTSYNGASLSGNGTAASSGTFAAAATMAIVGSVRSTANVGGVSAFLRVSNIQSSRYKRVQVEVPAFDGTNVYAITETWYIQDAAALTGVKFAFSSGNINDGRVLVEGCA